MSIFMKLEELLSVYILLAGSYAKIAQLKSEAT